MTNTFISGAFVLAGIVNLIPVAGLLSADRLAALYGLEFTDPNLIILMRHRALLFGIIGCILLYAAFKPDIQGLALVAGLVSMLGFVLIAWQVGEYNSLLRKVFWADVIAAIPLVAAAGLLWYRNA